MEKKQEMAGPDRILHLLLYPFPGSSHTIPILDLAHRLLARPGITITILVTPGNLPLLQPLLAAHPHPSLQPLILPAPPPPPTSTGTGPLNRLVSIIRGLHDLHSPALLDWFSSHASPPNAIVSDFFLGWTHHLARQLGIPRVVFSPSGVFGLSINFSLWRDLPKLGDTPENEISFPKLPNCPSYPVWQIPEAYRNYAEVMDPSSEFHRDSMLADVASWGLVFNSFAELEGEYIEYLKRDLGHDRVWAVGPLLPTQDDQVVHRGGPSSIPAHEVMTWLDSCQDGSVVYVCFGSRGMLTSKQMDELTAGLDQSKVRFILCVRNPDGRQVATGYSSIPDGFEDRVVGRGLVIRGWAPQLLILRHRAVGAFLTHCGWNSTIEGVTAGVVMLTWPMKADQFTNAKLLADQLGVGIRVGEGTMNIPEAVELARILTDSVNGARPERVRAKEISIAALSAMKPEGSSDHDLDDFVKRISEVKMSK
ncbi:UDP-glycosyltransferase 89B2-like [Punica granatum]|uniref:UDP-glycosyltransferase 89B2-like n=3 Tax=Punica granatum TaxID=22663 RepID=A0A218VZ89_PUNGR|nr:UDP-glycosyltransferase 89B2-like [Punica granatum]OWM65192.1 hypothetical protein CDL15_Pgr008780 [Punica granatum]